LSYPEKARYQTNFIHMRRSQSIRAGWDSRRNTRYDHLCLNTYMDYFLNPIEIH